MFVTARTVCAATRVKSGPAPGAAATACSAGSGARSVAGARAIKSGCSVARPDRMKPINTPASSRPIMVRFLSIENECCLRYNDAAGSIGRALGNGDGQHTVGQIRVHAVGHHRLRQQERAAELAMSALHLVILIARDARFTPSLQRELVVMHVNADLIAGETGQLDGENERVRGFTQINGGRPALRPMNGQPLEAMLNPDEVAERVPARKDHDFPS